MAASMLRLRAAAAAGGYRQFSSSAAYLMLPSNKMYSLGEKKVMTIDSSKIEKEFESDKVVGSSHGWVGLMKEEEEDSRSLSLWNPRSGSRVKLPPLDTMPHCDPKSKFRLEKVMVDDAECSRAIIFGFSEEVQHGHSSWLGLCCPDRCNEWTQFGRIRYCYYYWDVVACSHGRVYSLNNKLELVRWNVSDPRRPRREWKKHLRDQLCSDDDEEEKKKFPRKPIHHLLRYPYVHLVYAEQSGQLFLVTRHYAEKMDAAADADNVEDLWKSGIHPNKTVAFDVHLLVENYENGKRKLELRYMEHSLDGLVMFVGVNNPFTVAAADFPHLNPDSIYFTDHNDNIARLVHGGHDVGIYDYKNRTISSCYYPALHPSCKGIQRYTYPFWLSPTSTLKG